MHLDHHVAVRLSDPDLDDAVVLERISRVHEQVEQRLQHTGGVAPHQGRQTIGLDHQLQPLGAGPLSHQRTGAGGGPCP